MNSLRLYLNRISAIIPGAKMFGPQDVGINAFTYQPNYLTIPVNGAFSLGSGWPSENSFAYTTAFGVNDDFRMVHGAHQFAFGGFFHAIDRMVGGAGVVGREAPIRSRSA